MGKNKEKQEALKKFAEERHDDIEFQLNTEVVCPHCALSHYPDYIDRYEEAQCSRCDGRYMIHVVPVVRYSTSIIGDRVKS